MDDCLRLGSSWICLAELREAGSRRLHGLGDGQVAIRDTEPFEGSLRRSWQVVLVACRRPFQKGLIVSLVVPRSLRDGGRVARTRITITRKIYSLWISIVRNKGLSAGKVLKLGAGQGREGLHRGVIHGVTL